MHRDRLRLSLLFRAALPIRRISARHLHCSDSPPRLLRVCSVPWTERDLGSLLHGSFHCFFFPSQATAETSRLERYNFEMILFSITFVLAARLGTPLLGSAGYIVANIVNMGCRCVHHFGYLSRYAEKSVIRDIAVAPLWLLYEVCVCAVLGYLETRFKPFSMRSIVLFVGIGACAGISVLFVMWLVDSKTIKAARAIFSKQTKPAAKME